MVRGYTEGQRYDDLHDDDDDSCRARAADHRPAPAPACYRLLPDVTFSQMHPP